MPKKKWDYNSCREEALKHTTLKEFRIENPSAYNAANKNKWISEFTWLKVGRNAGFWTYERCYEEAKKCKTINEFANNCPGGHFRAKANGWVNDYDWFEDGKKISAQKRKIWNYDACYKLATECKKKSELKEKNNRAYNVARKNGWFKDYIWFLPDEEIRHQKRPTRVIWSYEKCREEALKYNTRGDFSKGSPLCLHYFKQTSLG